MVMQFITYFLENLDT